MATRFAVASTVTSGDRVVDATVGNGHDTELLARLVGVRGRVYGFDCQTSAIQATRRRLEAAGLAERVDLSVGSHADMFQGAQPGPTDPSIRCIMFNLGYLPGGNKTIITMADSTIRGLQRSCNLVAHRGLISVMVYRGHPGGMDESRSVDAFVAELPDTEFLATRIEPIGQVGTAAYAWHIRRI